MLSKTGRFFKITFIPALTIILKLALVKGDTKKVVQMYHMSYLPDSELAVYI